MNVDYFSIARAGRLIALDSLDWRQPELPGFTTPAVPFDTAIADAAPRYDTRSGSGENSTRRA